MNKVLLGLGGVLLLGGVVYVATMKSPDAQMSLEQSANSEEAAMKEIAAREKIAMSEQAAKEAVMKKADATEGSSMTAADAMMATKPDMKKTDADAMMKMEEPAMMKKDEPAMMAAGTYQVYSADKLALADTGSVVLFFKASWCPTCKTLDSDIKANLAKIPKGLTILEVDYDSNAALKQKYGVTYQHTFVQVDSKGTQITKWSGSPTLADLASKVK